MLTYVGHCLRLFWLRASRPGQRLWAQLLGSLLISTFLMSSPAFGDEHEGDAQKSHRKDRKAGKRSAKVEQEQSLPPGAVVDLCHRPAPKPGNEEYLRKGVVFFDLGGRSVSEGPEIEERADGSKVEHHVLRDLKIHNHVRNTFFGVFPMRRHYTIPSTVTAPDDLYTRDVVSPTEMIQAAQTDSFAAYSIACADWVMVPRVKSKSATWRQVKRTRKKGKKEVVYYVWTFDIDLTISLTAFEYDGKAWISRGQIEGKAGLMDLASDLAEQGTQIDQLVKQVSGGRGTSERLLSATPDPSCRLPLVGDLKDIADGFNQCGEAVAALNRSAEEALTDLRKLRKKSRNAKHRRGSDGSETEETEGGSEERSGENDAKDEVEPEASQGSALTEGGESTSKNQDSDDQSDSSADKSVENDASENNKVTEGADPEPDYRDLEQASRQILEAATSKNPQSAALSLVQENFGDQVPESFTVTVQNAKNVVNICKGTVDSVVQFGDKLRASVKNPTALATEAAIGFAACAGIPLSYDLGNATAPGMAQAKSKFCTSVRPEVSRGRKAMREVAMCNTRTDTERATLTLRKNAINEWWRFRRTLALCGDGSNNDYCLRLGREEGIKRGDMFLIKRDNRVRGFGYIVQTGDGGGASTSESMSRFRARAGHGEEGTEVEEQAKVGLSLALKPQYGFLYVQKNLETRTQMGGALEAGYNAGSFVPLGSEFWVRADVSVLVGEGDELFINLNALPEAQYYLFNRVALAVQIGGSLNIMTKTTDEDVDLSGLSLSVMGGLSLDVALHYNWNARVGATYSQGLMPMILHDESETITIDAGNLGSAQGAASVAYSF